MTKKTQSQMTSLWVERPWIDCWSERVQQERECSSSAGFNAPTVTAQLLTLIMILLLPSDRTSLSIVIGTECSSKNAPITGATMICYRTFYPHHASPHTWLPFILHRSQECSGNAASAGFNALPSTF